MRLQPYGYGWQPCSCGAQARRRVGCCDAGVSRGESGAVGRCTQPVADIRGMHCRADAVHSLLILFPPRGSYTHVVNGPSCATVLTLELQTAHLRTGHAPEEHGVRPLSRAVPLRVAGCQPRVAPPPRPARRSPSGNGRARSAQAPPPLLRVALRDNRRHGITRQPAQQPAVAYTQRAHA